ncbi:adenylate/guanylate cyclase domain-containing protein [soil metagenome]
MKGGTPRPADTDNEEYWRDFLTQPDSWMRVGRRVFTHLPSEPRCRMCTAPFAGPGRPLMRLIGKRPSQANPNMCNTCQEHMVRHHGGAEVEGAMLFADIRGSTSLAERMTAAEFHDLLDRFYRVASQAVFEHDGIVDKFVGDELVAHFFPGFAGERYVSRAVDAARALLQSTGHAQPGGPWVPVGAGVHAGKAWFGAVGGGTHVELTAVGDAVNTAARLASSAGAGEILVSTDAASAAGVDSTSERRSLQLKGKSEPIEVVVLGVSSDGG